MFQHLRISVPLLAMSVLAAGYCVPSHAIGTRFVPVEGNSVSDTVPLAGNRFHRDTYTSVGAIADFIAPLYGEDGNYLVEPAESWTWIFRQTSGTPTGAPIELARLKASFLGGDELCWSFNFCGPLSALTVVAAAPCMVEQDHEIELLHNGQSSGKLAFRPTRFTPEIIRARVGSSSLYPEVPLEPPYGAIPSFQHQPDSTAVTVMLRDNLGCNQPIDDAVVRLTSTTVPSDAAYRHLHYHFQAGDDGTGHYEPIAAFQSVLSPDQPDPNQPGYDPAVIEGKTATVSFFLRGAFAATLVAGQIGVAEQIKVSATRPAVGEDPEVTAEDQTLEVAYRVPDLVEVSPQTETDTVFADGGSCPHSLTPGSGEDLALWLSPETRQHLRAVARLYRSDTGRMLSINDGSLPFGGLFENNVNKSAPDPRNNRCHVLHRTGRDIDVNGTDSGGKHINCTLTQAAAGCTPDTVALPNQQTVLLRDYLTKLIGQEGGERVPEGTIHYRFPL